MFGGKLGKNDDEEPLWEIEEILDKKYDPVDRRNKYKIKWKGYSLKEATWEPVENLMSVQYMVEEFDNRLAKKNTANLAKNKKIESKSDDGFLSPQEFPSREVKAVSHNNEENIGALNNTKIGSSVFGPSMQNKNERIFENTIEFGQNYGSQGQNKPDSQLRANKAANEIVIDDDDDKPGHMSLNNLTGPFKAQNVSDNKGFANSGDKEKSVIDLGPFLSAKRSLLVEGDQQSSQRSSRFSDYQDEKRLPPNQYQSRSTKLFQHAFGQPAPPTQPNTSASFLSEKERERDQAKDFRSFGPERGAHKEEDRIPNRNRDRDGEASRERSADNSKLHHANKVMVKEEIAGQIRLGNDAGSIKTEIKDSSGIVRSDKPLEKKRTVLKKTLHAKYPLKKRVNLNVKGHYESIVNGYVTKQLDRQAFLELLCPEGNFKDDEIQQIKCISWDGKATMDPDDYYFKIIWKPRADGVQKAARYASWQEILEESPEEAADFIFEKLITIISKYGTFGEF